VRVDISNFELQNLIKTKDGLSTRRGLTSLKTPTAGHVYVGGFTLESPNTSEVTHYLFEQATATSLCVMRVFTEEFFELFSHSLGTISRDPVITYAVVNNQLMVNSPSFSSPLYGLVGGGVIPALKVASTNPDTTALDIPAGLTCAFGDRVVIAQGNVVFFSDPGVSALRTFAARPLSLQGNVYDMMVGPNGALFFVTSAGIFSLASDALGQGADVVGFISKVPIETTHSRNAAFCRGQLVVLQQSGVVFLGSDEVLDLSPYLGRRHSSLPVEVDDLRLQGEIHATDTGFVVGFRGRRSFYLSANLVDRSFSFVTGASSFNLVGCLRSREGESLPILSSRVVQSYGSVDFDGATVTGYASGLVPMPPDDRPVIRRVTISASQVGQACGAVVDGTAKTALVPGASTNLIGASLWSAAVPLSGRQLRTIRHSCDVRSSSPSLELSFAGGARRISSAIDVEVNGQGRARKDRN